MSLVRKAKLASVKTVDIRIALAMVSVATPYFMAMTNGIAPHGPAATTMRALDQ